MKSHFVDLDDGRPRTDNILKVAGGVVGAIGSSRHPQDHPLS